MTEKIPGRFQGMFKKILRNFLKDSGKWSRRFQGLSKKILRKKKIPGNL